MNEAVSMRDEAYWENLVKRSLCRFLLLAQLDRGPVHGYGLNQAIKEACQGCCEPTEAMVYSTVKELEEGGYVECRVEEHRGRQRRVCWLTPSGQEALRAAARVWEKMLPRVHETVAQAMGQHNGVGTAGTIQNGRDTMTANTPTNPEEVKELVRNRYGAKARRVIELTPAPSSNCGDSGCCGPADLDRALRLYSEGQINGLPASVVAASAGCGNPTAMASLRPGERVLDLGSGGGIDCFLAAQQVGATGRVIGLDMTPDMLELARRNQAKLGVTNVEFIRGELENIPLPAASVDVVISNCVVVLSPDKDAVFRGAFRVLAPGGRMHISDMMALTQEGPVRTDPEAWASCIAGAEHREVYLGRLRRAGFVDIQVTEENLHFDGEGMPQNVASVKVVAHKPA
ncbi:MAG: arsenite methyltransferase [Dehalococcoidia bacterium]|nr:arsenite methyltransferase [Dehalococcoidia bacterium]MSQ16210.1 arsenite methyltransferase [Dehalococcoidia bacterium]